MTLRAPSLLLGAAIAAVAFVAPRDAAAALPWVDRNLTLPSGDWAFNFGLGVVHVPNQSAAGINADMAVGLTQRVELGVRTGIRFGDAFDRSLNGDAYGRLFDRQTFGTGADTFANPEVRVRGAIVRGEVAEVGLEGRFVLPFETGTSATFLAGVPLAFHLGDSVRLDMAGNVVFAFPNGNGVAALSIPLDLWIQASRRVWLGPMTGIVVSNLGEAGSFTDVELGFGLGVMITHAVDFKTQLLFPGINQSSNTFGVGAGVEIRIE